MFSSEITITIDEEERFTQLQEGTQRLKCSERNQQTPPSKIQRVPHYLRDRKHFAKYYSPRLVSMGPIHHGEKNLQLGERYKRMWAAMYIKDTKQCAQALHKRIIDNLKELKDMYTEDAIGGFADKDLAWMLFVDGCSLLQILDKAYRKHPDQLLKIKLDQLMLVQRDVILLENQLPYLVLKLLSICETKLIKSMERSFDKCHHFSPGPETTTKPDKPRQDQCAIRVQQEEEEEEKLPVGPPPTHLLDHRRTIVLRGAQARAGKNGGQVQNKGQTYRNIEELKAAGIRVKRCQLSSFTNISFSSYYFYGELKLPEIIVDDTTAPTLLNVIAYEMCPDFQNDYEITSFVSFLDSLIDHPNDVKALRAAGVLHNALGSDEEVAKLFNTMTTDSVPVTDRYSQVRAEIEKHYKNKHNVWIAQALHDHFSTPWTIIAFLAASLILLLTAAQTWFAVFP